MVVSCRYQHFFFGFPVWQARRRTGLDLCQQESHVQEYSSLSNNRPVSGLSPVGSLARFFLPLAVIALAGFASGASAQTVPQLLPSTVKIIAGGGTSTPAKGGVCPVSGNIATDAYGDGCLATEVLLGTSANAPGPRAAIADAAGNVYFGDYVNGVVHRVDALTGVLTAVVGSQASSPSGACGGGTTNTATDAKGDGCLATLVHLSHPTGLVFSPAGDLYVADYGYGQVRKISFGNQSVVAVIPVSGGSGYTSAPTVTFSAPATGTTATGTATITSGVVTGVTITNPGSGYTSAPTVTFSAAPTGGTTATGVAVDSGIITLAAGSPAGTYGYNASNATTTVTTAQSILDGPYGLAVDNSGDLFIEDEYTASVLVVNTSANTNTVNNTVIPAGTVSKIAGTLNGAAYCTNSPLASPGCTYNHASYTEGIQANVDYLRNAYGLALDTLGNVYITHEYLDSIVQVAPSGLLTTYAGVQNTAGHALTRGKSTSIAIGSPFGVATDSYNNLYFTDAADGTIWRVDATTQNQYLIASGFGSSGTGFASTSLPGPGVFHVSVDPYADLFYGDTEKNIVGEVASGTQFGVIGANQPTDNVVIHFGVGDIPATVTPYTLTTGATNFSLGTATCVTNTDNTTDCTLPITATPTALGPFNGNLKVTSALGGISNFYLSGVYAQSPVTRTALTYTAGSSCTGTTTYSTSTPVTLTATVTANGPAPPVGTSDNITFFATNTATSVVTQLGTVAVTNLGTTSAPVYGATLSYTFTTPATYTLSAVYSGDSYFKTSTGKSTTTVTTSLPGFTITPTAYSGPTINGVPTVVPGETALFSFTVNQNVYTGTITFAVTGLPPNSSYSISPPAGFTAVGCSVTNTVALSIITQQGTKVTPAGFGAGSRGPWQMLCVLAGLGFALLVGLRRRRIPMRFGQLWMALALLVAASGAVACGKSVGTVLQPATPTGSYTITVTPSATVGTAPAPITFSLTVH
jgi:hypothetical protein